MVVHGCTKEKVTKLLNGEKQIQLDGDDAVAQLKIIQSVFVDTEEIDLFMKMALHNITFYIKDFIQQLHDLVYHLPLACPVIRAQEFSHCLTFIATLQELETGHDGDGPELTALHVACDIKDLKSIIYLGDKAFDFKVPEMSRN